MCFIFHPAFTILNFNSESFFIGLRSERGTLVAQVVKNLPAMQETHVQSLGWEHLLEKEMAIHSLFLLGKTHGQRILAGYSQCGHKSQTRLSD